jgi:hypothetical protein
MRITRYVVATVLTLLVCASTTNAAGAPRVFAVAGSGDRQLSGDGGLATDAGGEFRDVVALPHGGFLASGLGVRRIDAHGVITTVAGRGQFNFGEPLGDGGPAVDASLDAENLALLPGGGFLVADTAEHRVRMVNARGVISTVAGSGSSGLIVAPYFPTPAGQIGDGGPATRASLLYPEGLALLPRGGFLVADAGDNRVREVNAQGIITTVAGSGVAAYGGDGRPATRAGLFGPCAVAALPHGGFLIGERYGHRVRLVDARGIISTVAGSGKASGLGKIGDGGPATRAHIDSPSGLAVLPGGGFLIADGGHVWRVNGHGIIRALAGAARAVKSGNIWFPAGPQGGGFSGLSEGLGGSASEAWLAPLGLTVAPDGSILVAALNRVLLLNSGSRPPLAVAMRAPSVSANKIRLNVAASRPGRERVAINSARSGRLIAGVTREVPAGVSTLTLPHLPDGALAVRVTLRGAGGAASDREAIFAGRVLPMGLARAAIARRCCNAGPSVVPAMQAESADASLMQTGPASARLADVPEGTPPSIVSCHRFGAGRVDCQWGWEGRCTARDSAVLRNALVYLTETNSCGYSRRPRQHGSPSIAPLL